MPSAATFHTTPVPGIHHVTAIARDPQRNVNFYAGVLGLRLVKRTVNFDAPGTYHLYYGDALGRPGTILTFFPWPDGRAGAAGIRQIASVGLLIPPAGYGFWLDRLARENLPFERGEKFGQRLLALQDPDGLRIELITDLAADPPPPKPAGALAPEHAIRGVHSVTLWVNALEPTARVLTEQLGLSQLSAEDTVTRFVSRTERGVGRYVDVRAVGDFPRGSDGVGFIHHVAFRAADLQAQSNLREALIAGGLQPTAVIDRNYFHSIYFREPGGTLFESATDPPGFTVDETPENLGSALQLPPQYEALRPQLMASLPPLHSPDSAAVHVAPAAADAESTGGDLAFTHRWIQRPGSRVLLTLHGTGGDEDDLTPLARRLDSTASVLSPRGRVSENGMHRFFRRMAPGVFDEASIRQESQALADFIRSAARRYSFKLTDVTVLGYSNGANIAAALLLLHPEVLTAAILLRPMVPLVPERMPNLKGHRIYIGAGTQDDMSPPAEVDRLAGMFRSAGAEVTVHQEVADHQLKPEELEPIADWMATAAAPK